MKSTYILMLVALVAASICLQRAHGAEPAAKSVVSKSSKNVDATNQRKPFQTDVPNLFSREGITDFVAQDGCPRESVKHTAVDLGVADASSSHDYLAFCADQCGMSGCTYYIFLAASASPDKFTMAGLVDGVVEPLKSSSYGHRDLQVRHAMGTDARVNRVWKYNGREYQ